MSLPDNCDCPAKAEVQRLVEHIEHAMQALEQDLPGEAWLALKHAQRLSSAPSSRKQAP